MKPKHRTFCPCCQKLKLSFETEAKAENFLRYNADDIYNETGRKPIRAYYCMVCGGWHVTSLAESPHCVSRMEHNLMEYSKELHIKKESNRREALINELISKFREKIKALEKLLTCQMITKEDCFLHLSTLIKNFDVFKANVTGHERFIRIMSARMDALSRNCISYNTTSITI